MEQKAEDDEVERALRRKKGRGKGKGTGKGNILQQDRVIETSPTLKECIQDVLDEGATGSLPFTDDRAIGNEAPENDHVKRKRRGGKKEKQGYNREEVLEIRHLLEEDVYEDEDESNDRRMSTCDAEITEEMQAKVRLKQ